MKITTPHCINIEKATLENDLFRKIIYTTNLTQLVVMTLKPKQNIGMEVHNGDQFIRIEKGKGVAILNNIVYPLYDGISITIPKKTHHDIINTSETEMKLYTIYSPPQHEDNFTTLNQ